MKVLYATDGFEPATDAGLLIRELFRRENTDVTVVSVADYTPIPATKDLERAYAKEMAGRGAAELTEGGFRAKPVTPEGDAGEEIVRLAREEGADVVVVGAGRNTWLGRLLLGSASLHVLHHAPMSVLVVHQAPAGAPPHRVVVGTDGSDDAKRAVESAIALLEPARCRIEVVSAAEPLVPTLVGPGGAYVDAETYEDLTRRVLDAQAGYARESVTAFRDGGFRAEGDAVTGHPATQLLMRAEEPRAALVVVGSRGLGPVGRVLLGSVSDRVARHAPATLVARRIE